MERGLPIGCAPNVHVSLVLLPEECRSLSPRRYPLRTLKLKAMAQAFRATLRETPSGTRSGIAWFPPQPPSRLGRHCVGEGDSSEHEEPGQR